jgi:hypothetical protein
MTATTVSPWIGLAGVALGFLLGEGSRYIRYKLDIHRNRKIIRSELQSVLAQIPLKRDILQQAIAHMENKQIMRTQSVHMVAVGYYSVLEDLYPHLTPMNRNCLHVIFEHLRVAEEVLDKFEESFTSAVKDNIIDDPWKAFSYRLKEIMDTFNTVESLIQSYLSNKSIDVFNLAKY